MAVLSFSAMPEGSQTGPCGASAGFGLNRFFFQEAMMSIKPLNASGGSRVFCLPRRWPPPRYLGRSATIEIFRDYSRTKTRRDKMASSMGTNVVRHSLRETGRAVGL